MDQKTMFYEAARRNAERDLLFSDLVKDGMTREELARNIERRPALWARYASWLDKLPSHQANITTTKD